MPELLGSSRSNKPHYYMRAEQVFRRDRQMGQVSFPDKDEHM